MRKLNLSPLLWFLACALVIGALLPSFLLKPDSPVINSDGKLTALFYHWQIGYGPDLPKEGEWASFDAKAKSELNQYRGTIWLQRNLPELEWRNPHLIISRLDRFIVYLDKEPVYQFNADGAHRYISHVKMEHSIPLEPQDGGKRITIRVDWNKQALFGNDMVLIGEPEQFLHTSIRVELAFIIVSLLSLTAGIAGLAMYLRRKKALYGWFALFALSAGISMLCSLRVMQWFMDMSLLYYWAELLTPVAIWACIGFYGSALEASRMPLVRGMHCMMALYVPAAAVVAAVAPSLFWNFVVSGNAITAFAGFVAVSYSLYRYSPRKGAAASDGGTPERQPGKSAIRIWLYRGYWTFTVGATVSLVSAMLPDFMTQLLVTMPYLYRVFEGLLPNVLLLFMICMVMVIISRVRQVHLEAESNAAELLVKNKELEQFHRELERLVEQRTGELARANRILTVTLREKAETLAEISVLEERSRIAYEMHDGVGHTLTAAIVQLEATKRLVGQQQHFPVDKLDLLSDLVRKGLEDVRKAVRLMKTDEEESLPLEAALRELIQYTEDTMDIVIESRIELPQELELGKLTEQVLYHALQEGLTNAARHGKCSSVRFLLCIEGDKLQFRLVSDGEPFGTAVPGFGLTSMMERAELLGGEVTIRTAENGFGAPAGCELSIVLPLGLTLDTASSE